MHASAEDRDRSPRLAPLGHSGLCLWRSASRTLPLAWSSSSTPPHPPERKISDRGRMVLVGWMAHGSSWMDGSALIPATARTASRATCRRRKALLPQTVVASAMAFRGSLTQQSSLPHGFARLLSNVRLASEVREDHHRRKVRSPQLVELPVAINAQLQEIHALVHERVGDFEVDRLGARLLR